MSTFVALIIDHWSLVIDHWSLVVGHWSLVVGRWSLIIGESQKGKSTAIHLFVCLKSTKTKFCALPWGEDTREAVVYYTPNDLCTSKY